MNCKVNIYIRHIFSVRALIVLAAGLPLCLNAQFYRGSYQTFGKNRVQHIEKKWEHYDREKFNVYFYDAGKDLGEYTVKHAEEVIKDLEGFFDYRLRGKTYILVFNNLQEFRSSNIGLETGEEQNIGGTLKISGNKIFIYFTGNHTELKGQIREGIARILMFQMGYGEDWKEIIKNSALLTIPQWYSEGLVSYAAHGQSPDIEDKVRDLVMRGDFKNINRLTDDESTAAGHAVWQYVAEIYGAEVIPNIIYMSKVSRNIENGFLFVLGVSLEKLMRDAEDYYHGKYMFQDRAATMPRVEPLSIKSRKNRVYQKPAIDKDGKKLAYVTNEAGRQKVYVFDLEKKRRKKILRRGHRLDREPELIYPLIKWHPAEDILTVVYRRDAEIVMELHNFEEKDMERIELRRIDKVIDFSYSPDGKEIVLSAVNRGQTNLYIFKLLTRSQSQLTHDPYDYLYPQFTPDGNKIIFASNRPDDDIDLKGKNKFKVYDVEFQENLDIFMLDIENKSEKLTRITNTPDINETKPYGLADNKFAYLSSRTGTVNRFTAYIDSTVSRIDTAVHYRYFTQEQPVTNYKRNILDHRVSSRTGQVIDLLRKDKEYKFYITPLESMNALTGVPGASTTRQKISGDRQTTSPPDGSEENIRIENIEIIEQASETDTPEKDAEINIDEYVFESEKKQPREKREPDEEEKPVENSRFIELRETDTVKREKKEKEFGLPKREIYRRSFLMGDQAVQFDWNFANNLYQRFNGGPWVAPGMGLVARTDIVELMEDYIFEGGIRYAFNGNNTEVFARFLNRKKRLNKEYLFQRQSLTQQPEVGILVNTHVNKASYILTYPFSEVAAIKGTMSYRVDQNVVKATDFNTLNAPDTYNQWGGLKAEFIFDNTRSLGLNLRRGMRFKLFGEYYNEVTAERGDFMVFGADFRYYIKIHRNLIWANRFSQSTSLGNRRLVYYMGGTDNWIRGTGEQFDAENEIARDQGYFFQTIATPMRGFLQNVRNGNTFALINSEIRWPVFEYFSAKPIKSEFIKHFQIIGFGDMGSAWTGLNPYSEENSFNTRNIRRGGSSVNIKLKNQIDPLIGGIGLGLRSKILGYFIRFDYARGIEDGYLQERMMYFSLGLDF